MNAVEWVFLALLVGISGMVGWFALYVVYKLFKGQG
jgi:hypothetical protein